MPKDPESMSEFLNRFWVNGHIADAEDGRRAQTRYASMSSSDVVAVSGLAAPRMC